MDLEQKNKTCRCECGYTCGRECGLGFIECIREHYKVDCDHKWDGPKKAYGSGESSTCSICGVVMISHDMKVGP